MDDRAREDGVQGRGEVGLDEEEEDLLVGDGEQGRADDGRVRVGPDLLRAERGSESARRRGSGGLGEEEDEDARGSG